MSIRHQIVFLATLVILSLGSNSRVAADSFTEATTTPASEVADAIRRAEVAVQQIVDVPDADRTFENTLWALDDMLARLDFETGMAIYYVSRTILNGLRSIEEGLGTKDYARLRIGVGQCPPGQDLVQWVLSPMPEQDEDVVIELLPELTAAVETWMDEGVEAAMNRFNR